MTIAPTRMAPLDLLSLLTDPGEWVIPLAGGEYKQLRWWSVSELEEGLPTSTTLGKMPLNATPT